MAIKFTFPTVVRKDNRITIPNRYKVSPGTEVKVTVVVIKSQEDKLTPNVGYTPYEEDEDVN